MSAISALRVSLLTNSGVKQVGVVLQEHELPKV